MPSITFRVTRFQIRLFTVFEANCRLVLVAGAQLITGTTREQLVCVDRRSFLVPTFDAERAAATMVSDLSRKELVYTRRRVLHAGCKQVRLINVLQSFGSAAMNILLSLDQFRSLEFNLELQTQTERHSLTNLFNLIPMIPAAC